MVLADVYDVPIGVSLGIIALLLAASVAASLLRPKGFAQTQGSEKKHFSGQPRDEP